MIGETFKSQLKTRESNATHEIIFRVDQIPPLGYRSYFVEKTTLEQVSEHSAKELDDIIAIENEVRIYLTISWKYPCSLLSYENCSKYYVILT